MNVQDLKLVQLQERKGQGGGLITSGVLTMVIGGALLLAGVFASAKVSDAIPQDGFSADENTTFDSIKGNIFDALEIGGVVIIFVGIGLLIAGVRGLGA